MMKRMKRYSRPISFQAQKQPLGFFRLSKSKWLFFYISITLNLHRCYCHTITTSYLSCTWKSALGSFVLPVQGKTDDGEYYCHCHGDSHDPCISGTQKQCQSFSQGQDSEYGEDAECYCI